MRNAKVRKKLIFFSKVMANPTAKICAYPNCGRNADHMHCTFHATADASSLCQFNMCGTRVLRPGDKFCASHDSELKRWHAEQATYKPFAIPRTTVDDDPELQLALAESMRGLTFKEEEKGSTKNRIKILKLIDHMGDLRHKQGVMEGKKEHESAYKELMMEIVDQRLLILDELSRLHE